MAHVEKVPDGGAVETSSNPEEDFPPPPPELCGLDAENVEGTYTVNSVSEGRYGADEGQNLCSSKTESDQEGTPEIDHTVVSAQDKMHLHSRGRSANGMLTVERAIEQLKIYQENEQEKDDPVALPSDAEPEADKNGGLANGTTSAVVDIAAAATGRSVIGPGMFYQRSATSSVQISKETSVKNLRAQFEKKKIIITPKIEEPSVQHNSDEPKPVYV